MSYRRKLKIAQIAPIWYSVPPEKYGGIERIVHYLSEELVARGHKVTLFASANSKTKVNLMSCRKNDLATDKIPWSDTFWPLEHLSFAFRNVKNFDIIHSHTGIRTIFFQGLVKNPTLITFHNPLSSDPEKLSPALEVFKRHSDEVNSVFLSQSHKNLCPLKMKHSWVVYNGIDINLFKFNAKPENYFLWVGRVEAAKGIESAIEAAQMANVKLNLIGKIDPEKKEYFRKNIKPNLNEKIRYWGEIPQKKLVDFYKNARALLYPIEWNEPFGLVMTEAMACGTPVLVFEQGSAAEVVKNKETGFVVPLLDKQGNKNITGLVEAIKKSSQIKRENCRKWVEKNFTIEKMVDNYERVYYQIIKQN